MSASQPVADGVTPDSSTALFVRRTTDLAANRGRTDIWKVPLAAGKSVETPAGTLTVEAVREPEQTSTGTVWRVGLTLKEKRTIISLKQAVEGRFRCDGDELKNRVFLLTLPRDGFAFEAVIRGATALPGTMRIQVRDGDRRATIPFEFKNVRF